MHRKTFSLAAAMGLRLAGLLAALPLAAQTEVQPAAPPPAGSAAVPEKAQVCVACHGPGGNSTVALYPVLAGQTARYIYLELRDYKEGRRSHELMTPMAARLSRDDMRVLADYFAQQKAAPQTFKVDPEKARLGKLKADETLCAMCHLGGLAGQNEIPKVAGQHPDYVIKQLSDFKAHRRTNDAGNMTSVAGTLSEQDIENLAHYAAGL